MLFIQSESYMTGFPMSWETFSILMTVCFIVSLMYCADCFGRRRGDEDDIDTLSQRSTTLHYDITAPDTVDLNEYDILNNDDPVPNYESTADQRPRPCSKTRSSPIPIPKRQVVAMDKYRYVAYSDATTVCADDIYRRENKFSSSDEAWITG